MKQTDAASLLLLVQELWPKSEWNDSINKLIEQELIKIDLDLSAGKNEIETIRLTHRYQTISVPEVITPIRERANRWRLLMMNDRGAIEPPQVVKLRQQFQFHGPLVQLVCLWVGQMVVIDCKPWDPDRYPKEYRKEKANAMGVALSKAFGLLEEVLGVPDAHTEEQWCIHVERFIEADPRLKQAHHDLQRRNANLQATPAAMEFLKESGVKLNTEQRKWERAK